MRKLLRQIDMFISMALAGFWDWYLAGLIVKAQDEEAQR